MESTPNGSQRRKEKKKLSIFGLSVIFYVFKGFFLLLTFLTRKVFQTSYLHSCHCSFVKQDKISLKGKMSTGQNNVHSAFTDSFTETILSNTTNLGKLVVYILPNANRGMYCFHIKKHSLVFFKSKNVYIIEISLLIF